MCKRLKIKSSNFFVTALFSLSFILLPACSPHPAAGTWESSNDNEAHFTKIVVHFEPRAEIYTSDKNSSNLHCSWSASSKKNIKLECLGSDDQKMLDIYQLNITNINTAELIFKDKVIASFTQLKE